MDDYSRGYVFCDLILNPDLRTTIRAIIAAMRQWRVIPGAIVFDNGSTFKGKLLSVFCERVGIRLIHSAVTRAGMSRERFEEMIAIFPEGMIYEIQLEADAERLIAAAFGGKFLDV